MKLAEHKELVETALDSMADEHNIGHCRDRYVDVLDAIDKLFKALLTAEFVKGNQDASEDHPKDRARR